MSSVVALTVEAQEADRGPGDVVMAGPSGYHPSRVAAI